MQKLGMNRAWRKSRLLRLLALVMMLVAGGLILADFDRRLSIEPSPAKLKALHVRQQTNAEVSQRFGQGVVMLHAKRYDEAVTAFHRVIELKPDMPEAHVNMGYALIGLKQYAAARDFFESATTLRPNQINAYFGLAEALEGLHDLQGAIGAMQTYLHLAPANDKYRRKAESAVWEWREELNPPEAENQPTPQPAGKAENAPVPAH